MVTEAKGVRLENVSKSYGDVEAVKHVSLDVGASEFFSILGPSGCGKTTCLRMIAGFELPDAGTVFIGNEDFTEMPPHKRPVNTVFQRYALFPHLNVGDNVAFGLRFERSAVERKQSQPLMPHLDVKENVGFGLRFTKLDNAEKKARVAQALELVRLVGYERRKPHQLSGGEQQRVALARALVLHPSVLLLDEPLGALDAKLRKHLQIELKSIQREVGITFLYVTHDQEEALTMSDRLAVMSKGLVEQVGTPKSVYEEPASAFVADFLGVSNLMHSECDGQGRVALGGVQLTASKGATEARGNVRVTIRPERVRVEPAGSNGSNAVPATVERLVYLGSTTQLLLRLDGGEQLQALVANSGDDLPYGEGSRVSACLPADALRVIAEEGRAVVREDAA
jgi:spermidine/putrescine transport system ATP-binding protein